MTCEDRFRQLYRSEGIRAWLLGDRGRWEVEVGVAEAAGRSYDRARLEVLIQPRGADGLALGHCIPLCDAEVGLVQFPGSVWSWGLVELPRAFQTEHAERCYLRVTPVETSAT